MNSSLNLAEAAHYVFSSTLLKREVTGLVECCFVIAVGPMRVYGLNTCLRKGTLAALACEAIEDKRPVLAEKPGA